MSHIADLTGGTFLSRHTDDFIETLVIDSRRVQPGRSALFFALKTGHNDGHRFIADAHRKGIRNFIVSTTPPEAFPESNYILVPDTLHALQALAAFHRAQFSIPVIGITGSNGKTIVKEWLNQLLQEDEKIIRSPKSYNSQVGVPLSVWSMGPGHTLAIFEAGISTVGEMQRLEPIIRPDIGVLTNIGQAHNDGFGNDLSLKYAEKALLFRHCKTVIGPGRDLKQGGSFPPESILAWGPEPGNAFEVLSPEKGNFATDIAIRYLDKSVRFTLPFDDTASVENAITCCCVLLKLGYDESEIQRRMLQLHSIDMRLQLKLGINDCLVINDSYSADITSLQLALGFMTQQNREMKRTVILSDLLETGRGEEDLFGEIRSMLALHGVNRFIGVGGRMERFEAGENIATVFYPDTETFLHHFRASDFNEEIVLIKGARKYGFERIAGLFERRQHGTVLEIDLNALVHNLKQYAALTGAAAKTMAMVKAFSYGSGGAEIASVLQYHNVHYLGVAYADEGVDLRTNGITLPIMVMNAEPATFFTIVEHGLEPVIYSSYMLGLFENYLQEQGLTGYPVHIEVETGMNRLGFSLSEMEGLSRHLASGQLLRVQSVFSHLAASEDPAQDPFTEKQASLFQEAAAMLSAHLNYPFLKHISNSAAIIRHPGLRLDMVRLGIGLYGVEVDTEGRLDLRAVATLRSTVAQIREVPAGGSVSYNRRGVVHRDSRIATVRIGYADGYSRRFSNGAGKMWLRGQLAPVVGTVCMDMTMIDVTDIPGVEEGDMVIIFGPEHPVQDVAATIGTIPYEIMTGVSQRVKRVYFHE